MAKILQVTFQLTFIKWNSLLKFHWKRPNSQMTQCTSPICHNVPFKSAMCIFLFWMVHCGLWDRCIVCIVWFVNLAYCRGPINMLRSEAYQNRTDAGWSWTTHSHSIVCSLIWRVGPVSNICYHWCRPIAGGTSQELTNSSTLYFQQIISNSPLYRWWDRMVAKPSSETRMMLASLNCDWCLQALLLAEINQARIMLNLQLHACISHYTNIKMWFCLPIKAKITDNFSKPELKLIYISQKVWEGWSYPSPTNLRGYTDFNLSVRPSHCPSVCRTNRVRSVSSTILAGSISYLHILSPDLRRPQKVCRVFFTKSKIWIFADFFFISWPSSSSSDLLRIWDIWEFVPVLFHF